MERNIRLAFCSMATAVSVVIMLLTGIIPIGTYMLPAFAGLPQIAVLTEFGTCWAWPVYAAVSILSFFLAGDKEAALWYVLFFGCYPILKMLFEKRFSVPITFVLKFLLFNAAAVLEFMLAMWILNVSVEEYEIFGIQSPWLFLAVGNVVFAIFDHAFSLLMTSYYRKIHPHVLRWFHRK